MQRQQATQERHELYEEIMRTKETDTQLFFKLIKKQWDSPYSKAGDIEFCNEIQGENNVEKWAMHFANLATPKNLPLP